MSLSVAISGVLAFENFLLVHGSSTQYFAVDLIILCFLFEQMILRGGDHNQSAFVQG